MSEDRDNPNKQFYSLEEVAELLNVNYQLIYKLVRAGRIRSVRVGRVYRIRQGDLDEFIEQQTFGGDSHRAPDVAGYCTVCDAPMAMLTSLRFKCKVCDAPICADCRQRKHVATCPDCGKEAG